MIIAQRYISYRFVFFFINVYATEALKECFPPSVPLNGMYGVVKQQYTVKDKVQYHCNKGFLLVGKSERTCLSNKTWTGEVPLCDKPSEILRTSEAIYKKEEALKTMDGNQTTCSEIGPESEYDIKVELKAKANVKIVRLFLPEGRYDFNVSVESPATGKEICGTFHDILTKEQWKIIDCNTTAITDTIYIRVDRDVPAENRTSMVWTLCEVEVYTVDEAKCVHPPADFNMPDAQLVVDREKAMLKCVSTEDEGRLYYVCENKKWIETGEPDCEKLKNLKLRNVIIILAVVVAMSLGVLIVAVYIYRKRKNSVLILRQNELYGLPEIGTRIASVDCTEYADVNYEEIPLPIARTRELPEIVVPSKMPDLLTVHVTAKENV